MMNYTGEKEFASKGVAGTALGLGIGAVAYELLAGCNGGGLGGLFGGRNGNCAWSDREVMLQRQIDAVGTQQAVTAAVTPYQIREATCDMVKAQKFIPSREIVYTANGGRCGSGYDAGCDCYGI